MTLLIAVAFAVILGALVLAGVFMIRGQDGASKSGRMMRALAVRVARLGGAVRLHPRRLATRLDPPERHPAREVTRRAGSRA